MVWQIYLFERLETQCTICSGALLEVLTRRHVCLDKEAAVFGRECLADD